MSNIEGEVGLTVDEMQQLASLLRRAWDNAQGMARESGARPSLA